jgi:flagellar biogenesis protein FliO
MKPTASRPLQSRLERVKRVWRSLLPSVRSLATLLILSAAPAAFAQATNTLTLHSDLPEVGLSAIRALGALALVLALFFGGVWMFRNGQRLAWRKSGAPRLAILESRPLGNRFALYVVGYEQQRMLIGSSPAGISLLSQLPPAAETPMEPIAPPQGTSFTQCLQRVLRQK